MLVHQKIGRGLRAAAALVAAVVLAACGGGGNSSDSNGNADVRLINATLTHANLSLIVGSTTKAGPVAADAASDYASVDSGNSTTLQINDTTTGAAVSTVSPSLNDGDHYSVIAFETSGIVRTAILSEEVSSPSSGTAIMRVFDAAVDAGAVDVYVTDATSTTFNSPTYTFASSAAVQESSFVSFTPGTYRVRVTGAGNTADVRLDIPSITLASQGVATLVLTPTTGGTLVNGAVVAQQSTYTASRNTNARVRVAAAVTPGANVSASVGSTVIASGLVAPTVGAYTLVPSATAVTVSVNGTPIAAPASTFTAGSDATLMVYGDVGTAAATIIADDNHLPAVSTNLKMRLVNGIVGAPTPLSLTADFAVVATNVAPGAASSYTVIPSSTSVRLDVTSANNANSIYTESNLNVPGNAVYSLFMLGSASAPVHLLRRDR